MQGALGYLDQINYAEHIKAFQDSDPEKYKRGVFFFEIQRVITKKMISEGLESFATSLEAMIRSQEVLVDQWTKDMFLSTDDFTLLSVYKADGFFTFSEIKKNQLNGYDLDPLTKVIVTDTAPVANW